MPNRLSCWDCGRVWAMVNPSLFALTVTSEIECEHPDNLHPIVGPEVWQPWT